MEVYHARATVKGVAFSLRLVACSRQEHEFLEKGGLDRKTQLRELHDFAASHLLFVPIPGDDVVVVWFIERTRGTNADPKGETFGVVRELVSVQSPARNWSQREADEARGEAERQINARGGWGHLGSVPLYSIPLRSESPPVIRSLPGRRRAR
jgi:hypothetical protein